MNKIIKQDYHSEHAEMSKEKKDFIVTKNKIKLMTFIQENNYLLINCDKEIKIYNEHFGKTEQIKRFELISEEWTVEGGELTPTMKAKRKPILAKYEHLVKKIYNE